MIEFIAPAVKSLQPLNKGVPGVPLHALDAVQDDNARQVLRSIIDGWNVRNGASGNGDVRFVTARELATVTGRVDGLSSELTKTNALMAGFSAFTPGKINELISDLHTQVFESLLFKRLEARVDLVDAPNGLIDQFKDLVDGKTDITVITEVDGKESVSTLRGIKATTEENSAFIGEINDVSATSGSASARSLYAVTSTVDHPQTGLTATRAALTNEITTRANEDNALATAINTIWATVGDSTALISREDNVLANKASANATSWQQVQAALKDGNGNILSSASIKTTADAAASATGDLQAQYTVKIDTDGYVTGYGLASTVGTANPTSDFIVRADRFSIVSPSGNKAALIMTNNTINVFDENGNLRVKIGKLA